MNQVKKPVQDSGWSVHIYNGRRLLVTLYPSHAWVFLLGAFLSALLVLGGVRLSTGIPKPSGRSPTQITPPSQVD